MRKATWFLLRLFCNHRYKHDGFCKSWVCGSMLAGYIYFEKLICKECGNKKKVNIYGIRSELAKRLLDEKEKEDDNKFQTEVDREYYKYKHSHNTSNKSEEKQ